MDRLFWKGEFWGEFWICEGTVAHPRHSVLTVGTRKLRWRASRICWHLCSWSPDFCPISSQCLTIFLTLKGIKRLSHQGVLSPTIKAGGGEGNPPYLINWYTSFLLTTPSINIEVSGLNQTSPTSGNGPLMSFPSTYAGEQLLKCV